jgi:hypothetical protein
MKRFLTAEDAELRSAEDAEEEPVNLFLCVLCVISLRPLRLMDFNPMKLSILKFLFFDRDFVV